MDYCKKLYNIFAKINLNKVIIKTELEEYNGKKIISEIKKRCIFLKQKNLKKGDLFLFKTSERLEYFFFLLSCSVLGINLVSISQNFTNNEFKKIQSTIESKYRLNLNTPLLLPEENKFNFEFKFNDINIFFLTSGSTSFPKLIKHKLSNLIRNSIAFNKKTDLKNNTRLYHVLPVGYMAGILNSFLSPVISKGSIFLDDMFSAKNSLIFWNKVIENKINTLWLTPSMVNLLSRLAVNKDKMYWIRRNLKKIFVGTAPLHNEVRAKFENKFNVRCLESYGMTECMFISVQNIEDRSDNNSVGQLLKGIDCKIKNSGSKNIQQGEILIKSNYMMQEYYILVNKKLIKKKANLWLKTGDIGFFDNKFNLYISGRNKDIFIKGGININPKYLENIFLSYPNILENAVVVIDSKKFGQDFKLYIKVKNRKKFNLNNFKNYCRLKLNNEYFPQDIIIVKKFNKTISGKIKKDILL